LRINGVSRGTFGGILMDEVNVEVDKLLTGDEERAVELAGTGMNDGEVCAEIGVNVNTFRSWKNVAHRNFRPLFAERYKLAGVRCRKREKKVKKLAGDSRLVVASDGVLRVSSVPANSKWSEDTGRAIVEMVGRGMTQREICREVGIGSSTLCAWKNPKSSAYKEEFAKLYEYAYKVEGADALESEAKAIADDTRLDMYDDVSKFGTVSRPNNVSVQRARLQVDTIRWMCAIRNREKYGKVESRDSNVSVETNFVIQQFGSGKTGSGGGEEKTLKEGVVVAQNRISKEN